MWRRLEPCCSRVSAAERVLDRSRDAAFECVAAAVPGDDPERHAADTMEAGAGLCDPEAVRVLAREAPAVIGELRRRGMAFDDGGALTAETIDLADPVPQPTARSATDPPLR